MLKKTLISALLVFSALNYGVAQAEPELIDRVAVIVNDNVILEGEIDAIVADVKQKSAAANQALPSDDALRRQAIEKLILNSIQMQMAERMGIQISDAHLDSVMENIAQQQNITLGQLRQSVIAGGQDYERYREKIREEIALNEVVRANVRRRVNISDQEIDIMIKLMDEHGQKEEYQIGHILIEVDSNATQEEVQSRREVADKVIAMLKDDGDFKQIAIASSSGAKALDGGDWGYMGINEMPSLFASNIKGKNKGDIVGPLRSGAGFHIVKILDLRGREIVEVQEVKVRHILLEPSIILSEEKAKNMLEKFVSQVKAGEADFAELAKEHSDDPGSALRGGDLGWANPDIYAPKFKEQIAATEIGEYSPPFRSQFGWHVLQLLDTRKADTTAENKKKRAANVIYNRKFNEEKENWLREIREQAYVEVLVD